MNCILIDDEPLAREGLATYISEIDFLHLQGQFDNPLDAIEMINSGKIDLLLLDIQMPKLNGLDFLRTLSNPPLTILTTAFPGFALEGYELDVFDYLVKPITFQNFFKSMNKAKNQFDLIQGNKGDVHSPPSYIFIKSGTQFEKVRIDEILFVSAMQNYVHIYTKEKKHTTLVTLKHLLSNLPADKFLQTHKSYIVAIQYIDALEGNLIKIGQHQIPISRANKTSVEKELLDGKILKK